MHPEGFVSIGVPRSLDPRLLPERRRVWGVDVCWLPRAQVRVYGAASAEMGGRLGLGARRGHVPLLLHARPTRSQEDLVRRNGATRSPLFATATASYRTVLAFGEGTAPRCLKLSLGATIAGVERAVTEPEIARGIIVSRLLDQIPPAARRALGLHWFGERAGAAEIGSGEGYVIRDFPESLATRDDSFLAPAFSLTSARSRQKETLLEEWVKQSNMAPDAFVIERLVYPYVSVLSHLLLVHGLELEGHGQNVLFEVDRHGPTGNVALRDLSDAGVNVALRMAQRKALPRLSARLVPLGAPFPTVAEVGNLTPSFAPRQTLGGRETVESFGLRGFLWPLQVAGTRLFRTYDARRVERAYLACWQLAATRYLGVKPLLASRRVGIAMDEAILHFLDGVDWGSLGARRCRGLPRDALSLPLSSRCAPPGWDARLDSPWGSLHLRHGRPVAFRPRR